MVYYYGKYTIRVQLNKFNKLNKFSKIIIKNKEFSYLSINLFLRV